MAAFFEIHDSQLKGLFWNANQLYLHLRAVRGEWADELGIGPGKSYRQEVMLITDDAEMTADSSALPNWLLDGSYRAASQTANLEDIDEGGIPCSLVRANEVELQLEGMNEDTHEYITMKIRGKSISMELLGEPVFVQDLPEGD